MTLKVGLLVIHPTENIPKPEKVESNRPIWFWKPNNLQKSSSNDNNKSMLPPAPTWINDD